jgi:hypothetical protein
VTIYNPPTGELSENEDLPLSEDYLEHLKEMILADATLIPSKISGAEAGDLYVLRMENAAIIRKAGNDVFIQCSSLRVMGVSKTR